MKQEYFPLGLTSVLSRRPLLEQIVQNARMAAIACPARQLPALSTFWSKQLKQNGSGSP